MKKRLLVKVFSISLLTAFIYVGGVFAMEDRDLLEPTVDLDFVVLGQNQTATVTVDLSLPIDFGIIPVYVIGSGNVRATFARSTTNEIVFLSMQGFGSPSSDFNISLTPVTMNVSSAIDEVDDDAFGIIMHGILFSPEGPPYDYRITISH